MVREKISDSAYFLSINQKLTKESARKQQRNTMYNPTFGETPGTTCCFEMISLLESGAGEGTRTPDPIITNDVLYQLSYTGTFLCRKTALPA